MVYSNDEMVNENIDFDYRKYTLREVMSCINEAKYVGSDEDEMSLLEKAVIFNLGCISAQKGRV